MNGNQKALVCDVLTQLIPHREMAETFLLWIKKTAVREEMMVQIIQALQKALQKTTHKKQRNMLLTAKEKIEEIRYLEQKERDEEDVEKLLENM